MERLWRERIPLAAHLGIELLRLDTQGVELAAPLEPNRNHMGTGFAGSLLAAASLAGWATVVALLGSAEAGRIVVQETHATFLEPVTASFRALGRMPDPRTCARFRDAYGRRGRARIRIVVEILQAQRVAMRAESRFVAARR